MANITHEAHAQQQREYYAQRVKPGMLPAATPYSVRHVDELLAAARLPSGARVLDVGCGMGRFPFQLAERGFEVEGLDVSQFMLDRLAEFDNGRFHIRTWCADLIHHPPEMAERYDAVAGFFVLHHFLDQPQLFSAIARLVKPGGRIAFIEPNGVNPLYYLQVMITPHMSWNAERGVTLMRPGPLRGAMIGAGLASPAVRCYGIFPPVLRNTRWGGSVERAIESLPAIGPERAFLAITGDKPR